ncbi:hypothetical protein [Desulfatitalea tepidiphila]|uniref:hypothetical protein n=1 Tax=Desulfatitalea tepidiphila TaxID=1185843 RepID=UPI0006B66340|nr:hypothetical protein [Desulfatitalea tepidiphila]
MTTVTDESIISAVDRYFENPDIARNLTALCRRLPVEARVVVAGGAIRNIIIDLVHGSAPPTPDIDIFIGGLPRDFSLPHALADQLIEHTDLKGFRWHPEGSQLAYDLCLLPDFVIIEACHLEPTMDNLLSSIDFTVNAIVFDVRDRSLAENGCTADIRARRIDFNCHVIPNRELIAYRVLLMGHKTGFTLSETVFDFLKHRLELDAVTHLLKIIRSKLDKETADTVTAEYDALCRCRDYVTYLAGLGR